MPATPLKIALARRVAVVHLGPMPHLTVALDGKLVRATYDDEVDPVAQDAVLGTDEVSALPDTPIDALLEQAFERIASVVIVNHTKVDLGRVLGGVEEVGEQARPQTSLGVEINERHAVIEPRLVFGSTGRDVEALADVVPGLGGEAMAVLRGRCDH